MGKSFQEIRISSPSLLDFKGLSKGSRKPLDLIIKRKRTIRKQRICSYSMLGHKPLDLPRWNAFLGYLDSFGAQETNKKRGFHSKEGSIAHTKEILCFSTRRGKSLREVCVTISLGFSCMS